LSRVLRRKHAHPADPFSLFCSRFQPFSDPLAAENMFSFWLYLTHSRTPLATYITLLVLGSAFVVAALVIAFLYALVAAIFRGPYSSAPLAPGWAHRPVIGHLQEITKHYAAGNMFRQTLELHKSMGFRNFQVRVFFRLSNAETSQFSFLENTWCVIANAEDMKHVFKGLIPNPCVFVLHSCGQITLQTTRRARCSMTTTLRSSET
jgi:hypothetical protein